MTPEEKIGGQMNAMARVIDCHLFDTAGGEQFGFCLLVFPIDGPGQLQYVSNVEKASASEALQELLKRFREGGFSVKRQH